MLRLLQQVHDWAHQLQLSPGLPLGDRPQQHIVNVADCRGLALLVRATLPQPHQDVARVQVRVLQGNQAPQVSMPGQCDALRRITSHGTDTQS